MADLVDIAAGIEAEHVARGLARIEREIPVGAPGACAECGETMPRLVGGRCGYCRDGRRPPSSRFDAPAQPASPPRATTIPKECNAMPSLPNTDNRHTISVVATDGVLAAIRARAENDGLPLGQAAVALLRDGLEALADQDKPQPQRTTVSVDLRAIGVDELFDALRERVLAEASRPDLLADLEEANGRRDAAEAKLARVQAMLAREDA